MPTARWMEQCKAVPIHEVLLECGLQRIGKKGWGPCPACGEEKRGSSDKRGAVISDKKPGWWCVRCGASGDALNLVALQLLGSTLADSDKDGRNKARDWFADRGWCDRFQENPFPTPQKRTPEVATPGVHPVTNAGDGTTSEPEFPPQIGYPPAKQVKAFWNSCLKIDPKNPPNGDVGHFIEERGWNHEALAAAGVCRLAPPPSARIAWPAWWPQGRSATWRLVVPAFNSEGVLSSLHARATVPVHNGTPKVLWPKGYDATDLIMADFDGWKFLTRRSKPRAIIICEGLTDLCSVSASKHVLGPRIAVLSCANGGFRALKDVHFLRWVPTYCATDCAEVGDKYATQIATAIAPVPLRRIRIPR